MGIRWACSAEGCTGIATKEIEYDGKVREVCDYHFVLMKTANSKREGANE